jgi:hypothetical protein
MLATAAAAGIAGTGIAPARAAAPELRAVPGLAEGFYALGNGRIGYVDEKGLSFLPAGQSPIARGRIALTALSDFDGLVTHLPRTRWVWIIEHAALLRLAQDRAVALALLRAAIGADLSSRAPGNNALRLYDLYALAAGGDLAAFCADVSACSILPDALRLRLERWQDEPAWQRKRANQPLWKSPGSTGGLLVTALASA